MCDVCPNKPKSNQVMSWSESAFENRTSSSGISIANPIETNNSSATVSIEHVYPDPNSERSSGPRYVNPKIRGLLPEGVSTAVHRYNVFML
jgi:hypothetical protein